ncbi:hypothetical protein ACFQU7_04735 [Pseudoroseomonas wenyumeiae]
MLFLASLIFNLVVAIGVFFAFGGAKLIGRRDTSLHEEFEEGGRASLPVTGHGGTPPRRTTSTTSPRARRGTRC